MCFLLIIVVLIVYLRIVLCDVSAYLYYSKYLLSTYKQSIGNLTIIVYENYSKSDQSEFCQSYLFCRYRSILIGTKWNLWWYLHANPWILDYERHVGYTVLSREAWFPISLYQRLKRSWKESGKPGKYHCKRDDDTSFL